MITKEDRRTIQHENTASAKRDVIQRNFPEIRNI